VINAGTAGYYSAKELLKISNNILFFNPDIIIAFGGTNDFMHKYGKEYKGRPLFGIRKRTLVGC
jgi:hypothetical protein